MIVSKTPYRVSLLGGGSDFPEFYTKHGGACLNFAINKYVHVITNPRHDGKIRANYTRTETVEHTGMLKHDLIREALRMAGIHGGLEIATIGEIPAGTGLGSSSAVTVGLIAALFGGKLHPDGLWKKATEIEVNILNKPMGVQDQLASAYGGASLFEFDSIGVGRTSIPFGIEERLLLFATGGQRMASNILGRQKHNIPERTAVLKDLAELARIGAAYLIVGNYREFGELMKKAWSLKKRLASGITNERIDSMYKAGMMAGAQGGKICGAGGAGYVLFFAEGESRQNSIRNAMSDYEELENIGVSWEGSHVIHI